MVLTTDPETALHNYDVITCECRFGVPTDNRRFPGDVAPARCALEEDFGATLYREKEFVRVSVRMGQRTRWPSGSSE